MTTPEPGDSAPNAGSQKESMPWEAIAADPDFKKLLKAKLCFIAPATVFFLVYFFALPVLVGWYPKLMTTKIGPVNYAYLFAFSQFFMAWIVAGFYVVKAAGWDKSAAAILAKFNKH